MICTRNAGALDFEASLEWPPGLAASPVFSGGLYFGGRVRAGLEESVSGGCGQVRGRLFSPHEDGLRAALDEVLRDLARAAASREAALTARVLRSRRPLCANSSAIDYTAGLLWGAGMRVSFGVSWSPAREGADVIVGCRGSEERLAAALSRRPWKGGELQGSLRRVGEREESR